MLGGGCCGFGSKWPVLAHFGLGPRGQSLLVFCEPLCLAVLCLFFLFIYCFWVVGVWSLSPLAALFACVVFFWTIFAVFGLSQPFLTLLARLLLSVLKLP